MKKKRSIKKLKLSKNTVSTLSNPKGGNSATTPFETFQPNCPTDPRICNPISVQGDICRTLETCDTCATTCLIP